MSSAFELLPGMLLGVTGCPIDADTALPPGVGLRDERRKQDALLMRDMGIKTCLFETEWSLVEPVEGLFDAAEINRVRDELSYLKGLGVEPVVVLHHFADPVWFRDKGGWDNRYNIRFYLRYVEKMVRSIGHLAREFITFSEPNLRAVVGRHPLTSGVWRTPREEPWPTMSVIASAHIKAYELIGETRAAMGLPGTRTGFDLIMRVFEPKTRGNLLSAMAAGSLDRSFQMIMAEAMICGRFAKPLKNFAKVKEGTYCDFLGLSYYTRFTVSREGYEVKSHSRKNDIGWEIYPRGIVVSARKLFALRQLPIYITGNGVCDNGDAFRCRYIYEHLLDLCISGLPVERYYHRGLRDEAVWLGSGSDRFGLAAENGGAHPALKRSGRFYAKIIESGGVSEALYAEYVQEQAYHL